MTRLLRRSAVVAATAVLVALAPATAAHAAGPTVAITAPLTATVIGASTITAEASTDPSDDYVSVTLYLDGAPLVADASTCTGDTSPCTISASHDFTGDASDHTVYATVETTSTTGSPVTSDSVVFTAESPDPTVSVSPTNGTLTGVEAIAVSASTDTALTDFPKSIVLVADAGTAAEATVGTVVCVGDTHSCTGTVSWDVTGMTGTHTLDAAVTTVNGVTAPGTTRTFTVSNPDPTASISPTSGTLSGPVTITVSASTGSTLTDYPMTIVLVADAGTPGEDTVGTVTCTGSPDHACSGPISWDVTGLTGTHTLDATVTTTRGATGSATQRSYTASSPAPSVTISPGSGALKGAQTISLSASTASALTDYPASIEVVADLGTASQRALGTVTCSGSPQHSCSGSIPWDLTGLSGDHTIDATLTTTRGVQKTAARRTYAVTTPAPVVTFISPADLATVKGSVTVSVSASTDSALTDYPRTVAVVLDRGLAGERLLGTVACAPAVHTCTGSVAWDATGIEGAHTLDAHVVTTGLAATDDAPTRTVTASSPVPVTAITSPTDSASVSGTVFVSAVATTDTDLLEYPTAVDLYVDGTKVDSRTCDASAHSCTVLGGPLALSWDATGITGTHVLKTVVTTTSANGPRAAESSEVSVAVTTPPFGVVVSVASIDSRSVLVGAGATTTSSGTVAATITATTDAGQTEFPASIDLLVDAIVVGTYSCPQPLAHSCIATLSWDASHAAGAHRIAARVTTNRAHSATSPTRAVLARSGARMGYAPVAVVSYGGVSLVRGRVASTTTGLGLVGIPVRVVIRPAVGLARTVTVRTGAGGWYAVSVRVYANTRITSTVGSSWLAPASRGVTIPTRAPLVCSTSATSYRAGAVGTGTCVVRNLPVGTGVRLRYNLNGRWTTLASGRTSSTRISFTFRFTRRGTYYLQVNTATNRVYYATVGRLMKVTIR